MFGWAPKDSAAHQSSRSPESFWGPPNVRCARETMNPGGPGTASRAWSRAREPLRHTNRHKCSAKGSSALPPPDHLHHTTPRRQACHRHPTTQYTKNISTRCLPSTPPQLQASSGGNKTTRSPRRHRPLRQPRARSSVQLPI